MKEKIFEYLGQAIGQDKTLGHDDDIFKMGYVNSMFALQLVMFLESEFGIAVENEDLDLNNFNTVNHIEQFVQSKQ